MNEMPQTTTFVMDLNSGPTQTLSDSTYDYIYGNGRIAQGYDPYGSVTTTAGSGSSSYGFTNEYQNSYIMECACSRLWIPSILRYF
jgi:hypothetical protein